MVPLLTDKQAAHWLALDADGHRAPTEAVRYLCRSGQLRHCKVGNRLRFKPEWIEEYITRNTVAPIT